MDRRKFLISNSIGAGVLLTKKSLFSGKSDSSSIGKIEFPFLWGAQYYRAPTPGPNFWENDLKHMAELGFTDVKFWAQWRWSHRAVDNFYYDDLDQLMRLAMKYNLRVTLNVIGDVAPIWLYQKYPDAKQISNNGMPVEPQAISFRQLGGFPGPCYNHPGALEERKNFFRNLTMHFKEYSNLAFWDVWNEPELSFPQRDGNMDKLVCYCPNCKREFIGWLRLKYETIETLNLIWGRCYSDWEDLELPKSTDVIKDFVDWREFQSVVMSREAKWKLDLVKELDPNRIVYLHVVPNTMQPFNAVGTCVNDFEVAKYCDVFAATMNNGPFFTPQVVSAGAGKICYNVESHINGGSLNMHQAVIGLPELLNDFIPQIGLGIKGFLFWQYHPEMLGNESPAWGLVNPDGSDRTVTKAAQVFWKTIHPYTDMLLQAKTSVPTVGIWKSSKNEIFHFAINKNFDSLANGVNAYANFFYQNSYNYCFVDSDLSNLNNLKLLIMPSCYYLTRREAEIISEWVINGGVLLNEAHLGAYNDDKGRHSDVVPGFGLAEKWEIKEIESTSTLRLKMDMKDQTFLNMGPDVKKMLQDFGTTGGQYVPVAMEDGSLLWGTSRYAGLQAKDATILGRFSPDLPCIIKKRIGKGKVYYCGTNIGEGSTKNNESFARFMSKVMADSQITPMLGVKTGGIRADEMTENGKLKFFTLRNMINKEAKITLQFQGQAHGLFSNISINDSLSITLPSNFCDIFVVK